MPSPTDPLADPPDGPRCFACGHRYAHLGRGVHPGKCPSCGSRGVSPAGSLRISEEPLGVGSDGVRFDAVDATGRTFSYWVATLSDGVRAQLVRIRVASTVVEPGHEAWPDDLGDLVPDSLPDAVRTADLELTAPASLLE